MGCEILGPAGATVGEVIAVTDQAFVQLAGEQWNAVHTSVVAEPMAGDAHLAAPAGQQDFLVEVRPSVHRDLAGSGGTIQGRG